MSSAWSPLPAGQGMGAAGFAALAPPLGREGGREGGSPYKCPSDLSLKMVASEKRGSGKAGACSEQRGPSWRRRGVCEEGAARLPAG